MPVFRRENANTDRSHITQIHRPFSWINSRIFISIPASQDAPSPDDAQIGEVQQEWHVYRRRYNHFVSREGEMEQFGTTDAGLLAWDFPITNEKGEPIGSINRCVVRSRRDSQTRLTPSSHTATFLALLESCLRTRDATSVDSRASRTSDKRRCKLLIRKRRSPLPTPKTGTLQLSPLAQRLLHQRQVSPRTLRRRLPPTPRSQPPLPTLCPPIFHPSRMINEPSCWVRRPSSSCLTRERSH